MRRHYIYLVFYFFLEWTKAQSGLFRINTGQDTVAYMHSFKPPFAEKLFFWEPGASAKITPEYVELTPATQGQTGFIWNKKKANMKDWENVFEFKLAGRSDMGGDGFAFWYTDQLGLTGQVYGSTDYWTGLGIFFDTFDNDREDESPLISVCINDGTQSFIADRDGAGNAMGTCSFKIRNTPEKIAVKIRYVNGVLSVQVALNRDVLGLPIYLHCVEVKSASLAPEGFFGFSAHTGDLADSHHIYSMTVKDLSPIHTNLNDLKKKWDQEQETLHLQHNDMTESDFKHNVLTQLRQTQEEVNMIEMATLADAKEIKKGLEMVSLLEVLLNNVFNQFRKKMGTADMPALDIKGLDPVTSEKLASDLQKIKTAVQTMQSGASVSRTNQASAQITEMTKQIDSLKKEMEGFRRTVGNTKGQVSQIISKLKTQNAVVTGNALNSGGGSSWLTYFIISIIFVPLGGVVVHFCKPKKKKFGNEW